MSLWTRWLSTRTRPARRRAAARPVRRPLGLLQLLESRDVPTIVLSLGSASIQYGAAGLGFSVTTSGEGSSQTVEVRDESNQLLASITAPDNATTDGTIFFSSSL